MNNDTQILLITLVILVGVLIYIQNNNFDNANKTENFDNSNDVANLIKNKSENLQSMKQNIKQNMEYQQTSNNQMNGEQMNNQMNNGNNQFDQELDTAIDDNNSDNSTFSNPQDLDINPQRNSGGNSVELRKLIREVNTGNDLLVDSPDAIEYRKKTKSINSAKNYRKINYKDSEYRTNFDGMPTEQKSKDELDKLYDNSLVFKNSEYTTNNNYTGVPEYNDDWGTANLQQFGSNKPETQQQKVQSLYDVNAYLPNKNLTNSKLEEGFQILDNPVAVSDPNLIPVLKSIPISTTSGSNGHWGYRDIRSLPPCPKTVVAPFLNSSIMPDIYATQRGDI